MDVEFEVKVIECLTALEQSESIEQILARYPRDAAQLRPILLTARALPRFRMEPSEAAKMKARRAFLAQAAQARATAQRRSSSFMPRLLTAFASVALICILFGGGAVAASGSALPGDPLYGLKRTVENVRLSLASDRTSHDALTEQFAMTRRDETSALLDAGRKSEVEFSGKIESMQTNAWVISGLVVQLDKTTTISGEPTIDRSVDVRGRTTADGLFAASIVIESPASTPEPTDTPQLSPTNTPQPTPRSTDTPEPPTIEPTEPPTAEPAEIEFTGTVDTISTSAWTIDGITVGIDANTEIRGSISVGQRVKVTALRLVAGQLMAQRIELLTGGGDNQNNNSNDNENANHNQNRNDNQNDNQNENHNDNQNRNDNHNDNQNRNDNHNDNQNRNENENQNHNQNQNDNGNQNENENHNQNQNYNGNHNENQNYNQNQNYNGDD
jgi:hypothetical protein